jgi:hypothetical protein
MSLLADEMPSPNCPLAGAGLTTHAFGALRIEIRETSALGLGPAPGFLYLMGC